MRYRHCCRSDVSLFCFSFNPAKKQCWEDAWGALNQLIVWEYIRHGYLSDSAELNEQERAHFDRVAGWEATDGDIESPLINLTRLLFKHHGRRPVVLIDEYDAPVMAARDNGYYDEMVSFLKGWLTAALKDGGQALAFGLLKAGGSVEAALDLSVVFSDLDARPEALWSLLYLAGYLTTDDTEQPNSKDVVRRLSIPNLEIASLYRSEIIDRFAQIASGRYCLIDLHRALIDEDADAVAEELAQIEARAYDVDVARGGAGTPSTAGSLRYGIVFSSKSLAVPAERRPS